MIRSRWTWVIAGVVGSIAATITPDTVHWGWHIMLAVGSAACWSIFGGYSMRDTIKDEFDSLLNDDRP